MANASLASAGKWPVLKGTSPAWLVLGLSLAGTVLSAWLSHSAVLRQTTQRFQTEMAVVEANLTERLRAYEQVLRGGVSAFYSWPSVTRETWRRYVEHLEISKNYPGIQGIGFARVVPPGERQAHEREVRSEGFPDYRIWPEGDRQVYTAIVYLEPFDWRNQRAFGYDMFQEPVRGSAMARARDTGRTSLSGKVQLVQETGEAVQAGFLMYLPVYENPEPGDVAARRRQLIGYVYSPFRMGDFMRGLLGSHEPQVALQVFDGDTVSDPALMESTVPPQQFGAIGTAMTATVPLGLMGRTWTLRFAALPPLHPDLGKPLIVAAAGLTVSFLLWAIVWSLARNRMIVAAANERLQSDIGRRERAEAQLRGAEAGFRYLFEKNPNPMWVFDRETLVILEVNDAAVAHYGYTHDEFRRLKLTELRPTEDVPKLREYMRDRSPGLKEAGEWRHVTKDGRTIDVEIISYYLEFMQRPAALVVARDVTESKRAEQSLKESEAAARGVLDTALDAYVRMDREGVITEWNRMAEQTFGWTRGEVVGRPLGDVLVPPDQRASHERGLERYRADGEGPLLNRRIELQALHRKGNLLPVEVTIFPVRTDRGEHFSAFLRDLTESKRAEGQLRQAQRMEAIGQLAGGIAHDFNNLLTVIIGNLELAALEDAKSAPPAAAIAEALAAAEKGAALTHRLLAYARQQTLQPELTDLNRTVTGMIDLLRRTLGEDVEIEVRLDESLWPELADKSQVENALLNLAINARDAMPGGGKLTIETGNVSLDKEYAARNAEVTPGDYVMLAVTDTGTGMPPDVVDRVFEPFFTTKETGMGSGLGLSMIYGFAKQSGGHLKIYSEVGHGTTVRLYLPRAGRMHSRAGARHGSAEVTGGRETILIVEDEDAVRRLVARNLSDLGYRVLEASDGKQATTILESDEAIELLFTDVVLSGGVTGRELAERARQLRPDMRVLFTSGYTQNSIVHQGKLDEGVQLLSKPYRREDLARKIREVLGPARSP
jgi:PAS domain S-box-containing protein